MFGDSITEMGGGSLSYDFFSVLIVICVFLDVVCLAFQSEIAPSGPSEK